MELWRGLPQKRLCGYRCALCGYESHSHTRQVRIHSPPPLDLPSLFTCPPLCATIRSIDYQRRHYLDLYKAESAWSSRVASRHLPFWRSDLFLARNNHFNRFGWMHTTLGSLYVVAFFFSPPPAPFSLGSPSAALAALISWSFGCPYNRACRPVTNSRKSELQ